MSESSLRPHSKDAAPTLAPLEPVASSASPASQAQSTAAETTTTPVSTSETVPAASQSGPASVENLTETLSNLVVSKDSDPSKPESSASTTTTNSSQPKKDVPGATEVEEELSPEEAKLRAMGLKSTHRPGFYIHLDAPKRLRIQTKSKTYDLDRYCPHARADMLKWASACSIETCV
ncbi:hypothetical protein BGW38_001055 [Lunasporangiospora selenospora]|uniref:Uncharacterized protein n=1 Tax=Lunasporangiospora selenospora TaxID=979761 RepID=A0A9P6KEJ4_9FUNG|nr:hypothetical protein BGW38_001055 [Lunasporangiospora selenospora]